MNTPEEISLLEKADRCDSEDAHQTEIDAHLNNAYWRKIALALSALSVFIQLGLGVSIFVFAWMQKTPGGLGLAIDIILDVLTTLVVIWRYRFEKNESKACVLIAVLFVISGIALSVKATYNLSKEWIPYFKPRILLPIEVSIAVTFAGLMYAKIYVARKLSSQSLMVDGINTGCGLVMAVMNLISLLVYQKTNLWFLDSVSATIIALFLFFFGLKLLISSLNCLAPEDKRQ
ncbi:transmembrane protein 163a-like [Rhopilema esculentum]|uniref:transmembrane protein 163a-like n=1 Tax=Rhopilema esculentum TaxID=499914 RepID=UPI0031D2724D